MVAKGSSLRKHPMGRRFHGAVLAKGEGRDSYLPNEGNVQGPGELDTSVSLCNSNAPTAELSSRFWAAGRIVRLHRTRSLHRRSSHRVGGLRWACHGLGWM